MTAGAGPAGLPAPRRFTRWLMLQLHETKLKPTGPLKQEASLAEDSMSAQCQQTSQQYYCRELLFPVRCLL